MKLIILISLIISMAVGCTKSNSVKKVTPAPVATPTKIKVNKSSIDPFDSIDDPVIFTDENGNEIEFKDYNEKPTQMSDEDQKEILKIAKDRIFGSERITDIYLIKGNAVIVNYRSKPTSSGYQFGHFQFRKFDGKWIINATSSGIACTRAVAAPKPSKKWWEYFMFWK